jgi:hypothetical protein
MIRKTFRETFQKRMFEACLVGLFLWFLDSDFMNNYNGMLIIR